MWKSEDNSVHSVLPFYFTLVQGFKHERAGLHSKCLYPQSHFVGPYFLLAFHFWIISFYSMTIFKLCLQKDITKLALLFPQYLLPQGQEPGWQSLGGSVFPSPEEVISVTSPGTEPTHTTEPLGTGTVSAELSSPWAVGDSEQSECPGARV